jgi:hypothetical protein
VILVRKKRGFKKMRGGMERGRGGGAGGAGARGGEGAAGEIQNQKIQISLKFKKSTLSTRLVIPPYYRVVSTVGDLRLFFKFFVFSQN